MINLQITPAEFAQFAAALERAIDCPFIAEDDATCDDLNRLLGALEGAALAAAWYQLTTTVPFLFTVMRKVERLMNAAISDSKNFKSRNTEVVSDNTNGISSVFLHGNLIAEVGDTFIRLFDGGWQSNTTKSRLNAILSVHGERGDRVFQKDWNWFLQMNTVQGLTVVPFFSSMRLG